ncbi:armadillo-type protein [Lipomyces arxii]|uniref:armadillo-type protein n=1 Tax=Lipomyces arxii TaxID=56418 RepID=UPI0034CECAF4
MDQEVVTILSATQSPDHGIRTAAEQNIKTLQETGADRLVQSLLRVAASSDYDISTRQSSVLTLKFTVLRTWSIQFDEFTGHALDQEVKAQIRAGLFMILTQSCESKLGSSVASLISRIATVDFPDEWPGLFDNVMALLRSNDRESVRNALIIFKELLDDGLTYDQFTYVAAPVFDALRKLLASSIDVKTKASAIDTVKSALNFFDQSDRQESNNMTAFIKNSVDIWSDIIAANFKTPIMEEQEQHDVVKLKISCIRVMQALNSVFQDETAAYAFEKLFLTVWSDISVFAEVYARYYTNYGMETYVYGPDEYPRDIKLLVTEEFEYMRQSQTDRQVLAFLKTPENMNKLVFLCISGAQINLEDESEWTDDGNVFVAEELSLSTNFSCRTAASDFLLSVCEHMCRPLARELQRVTIELDGSTSDAKNGWRLMESAMFLLESVLAEDTENGKALAKDGLDELFAIVSKKSSDENVFLRARSYVLCATLLRNLKESISTETANKFFGATLRAASGDSSFVVRADCLLACQRFLSAYPHKHSKSTQDSIVQAVVSLIHDASDETPSLLIDSLECAIKIGPDLTLGANSQVIQILFQIAAKDASNVQLSSDAVEAFKYLAEHIEAVHYQAFCEITVPPLISNMSAAPTESEMPFTALAVNLLSVLIDHAPSPLPSGLVGFVLSKLASVLLNCDDMQVLQFGSEFLTHIIQHDAAQLRDWRSAEGVSGIDLILNFIAKLLDPNVDESSAMCIGDVVTETVDKYGRNLGDMLGKLLSAVAQRLQTATRPTFVQNLILVFAHMATIDPQGVVEFLVSVDLSGSNGLVTVLDMWLDNLDVFRGDKEISLNILALGKLYLLHDARIESIMLKGDLIVENTGRILTRLQAKSRPLRYTSVPAHVKIVKLFLKELSYDPKFIEMSHGGLNTMTGEEKGDEGAEWEDVFNSPEDDFDADIKQLADRSNSDDDSDIDDGNDLERRFDDGPGIDRKTSDTLSSFFNSLCQNESKRLLQMYQSYFNATEKSSIEIFQRMYSTSNSA